MSKYQSFGSGFASTFDADKVGGAINEGIADYKKDKAVDAANERKRSALARLDIEHTSGPVPEAQAADYPTFDPKQGGTADPAAFKDAGKPMSKEEVAQLEAEGPKATRPGPISDYDYETRKRAIEDTYNNDMTQADVEYYKFRGMTKERAEAEKKLRDQQWVQGMSGIQRDALDGKPDALNKLIKFTNMQLGPNGGRYELAKDGTLTQYAPDGSIAQAGIQPTPQMINDAFGSMVAYEQFRRDADIDGLINRQKAQADMKHADNADARADKTLEHTISNDDRNYQFKVDEANRNQGNFETEMGFKERQADVANRQGDRKLDIAENEVTSKYGKGNVTLKNFEREDSSKGLYAVSPQGKILYQVDLESGRRIPVSTEEGAALAKQYKDDPDIIIQDVEDDQTGEVRAMAYNRRTGQSQFYGQEWTGGDTGTKEQTKALAQEEDVAAPVVEKAPTQAPAQAIQQTQASTTQSQAPAKHEAPVREAPRTTAPRALANEEDVSAPSPRRQSGPRRQQEYPPLTTNSHKAKPDVHEESAESKYFKMPAKPNPEDLTTGGNYKYDNSGVEKTRVTPGKSKSTFDAANAVIGRKEEPKPAPKKEVSEKDKLKAEWKKLRSEKKSAETSLDGSDKKRAEKRALVPYGYEAIKNASDKPTTVAEHGRKAIGGTVIGDDPDSDRHGIMKTKKQYENSVLTKPANAKDRRTSDKGLEAIKSHEGFRPKPYQDSAGVWTIGYGTVNYPNGGKVKPTDKPISEERATELLRQNVEKFEHSVARAFGKTELTDNEFDVLVSLAYNGGGNLFTGGAPKFMGHMKSGRRGRAALEFMDINKAKDKKTKQLEFSPGLLNRRVKEAVSAGWVTEAEGERLKNLISKLENNKSSRKALDSKTLKK